jgi:hypothetical protein
MASNFSYHKSEMILLQIVFANFIKGIVKKAINRDLVTKIMYGQRKYLNQNGATD